MDPIKRKKTQMDRRLCLFIIAFFSIAMNGCASFNPRSSIDSPFLERVQTQTQKGVRVKTAVPSAKETLQIFGVDLYNKGIQPVWFEIDNKDDQAVWFMPVGLDPLYFTPLEAAFSNHSRFSSTKNMEINRYFFEQGEDIYIHVRPGTVQTGFIFTNLDLGTKSIAVDLMGEDHQVRSFTFFIPVPGLKIDHHKIDFMGLYPPEKRKNFEDEQRFIAYLEALPCCAVNKNGNEPADPLNLVVI
jgi:hypothetical protein